jgi:septation ring formation regulator EzrA
MMIEEEIYERDSTLGIRLNKKKTKIVRLDRPFKYLQHKYTLTSSGSLKKQMNPKRITCMKRRLKKYKLKLQNGEMNYQQIEDGFKSWYGNYCKVLTKRQRKNIIHLYEDLFDKEVEIIQMSGKWKMRIA